MSALHKGFPNTRLSDAVRYFIHIWRHVSVPPPPPQGLKDDVEDGTLLGAFTYDQHGGATQTFQLPVSRRAASCPPGRR